MPTMHASPADEQEQDGISPLLSRAPPPRPPLPPAPPSSSGNAIPPPPPHPPLPANREDTPTSVYPSPTNTSEDGDAIPEEHKRVPGLILRSPLSSPTAFLRGLGIVAGGGGRRKPPPPPIVVHAPPPLAESKSAVVEMVSVGLDTAGTIPPHAAANTPGLSPPAKPKRRTVWGMIDGWWDLGLLERMNTVRRKNGRV